MASQHNTADARVLFQAFCQLQPEIKSRALPFHPADGATKQLLRNTLSVFRSCNSYGCIRMQVINMFEGKKSMQRSINGRCFGIKIKNAMVEQGYHFIFMRY